MRSTSDDLWVLHIYPERDSEGNWNYKDFQILLSGPTAERKADVAGLGGDPGTALLNAPLGVYMQPKLEMAVSLENHVGSTHVGPRGGWQFCGELRACVLLHFLVLN